MPHGVCGNCGESDINSQLIYECPHCGNEFHDRTWLYIEETLETADEDTYPVERVVDGCAREVRRIRGTKPVAYQSLPTTTDESIDDTPVTEKETTTMIFQGFQCPHCFNWSTRATKGLKPIPKTPTQHVLDQHPDTENVILEFKATNFQSQLSEFNHDDDHTD